jgi:hypothetical protein
VDIRNFYIGLLLKNEASFLTKIHKMHFVFDFADGCSIAAKPKGLLIEVSNKSIEQTKCAVDDL